MKWVNESLQSTTVAYSAISMTSYLYMLDSECDGVLA